METSNRARWKVRKNIFGRIAPGPLPGWEVIEPNYAYTVRFAPNFHTWEEALAYADRRSRTVEVVLPRLTALPTQRHIYSRGWLIDKVLKTAVHLEPEHRVPVALAILAFEEKQK